MSLRKIFLYVAIVAGLVACLAGGLYLIRHARPQPEVTLATPAQALPAALPPGTITFAPHAPQLSSITVTIAEGVALPISEPLFGRIAYDENHTTRVSSPVAGRVTRLQAEVGDTVAVGKVLAVLDAPDLATAQADLQKARADEDRKKRAFDRAKLLFDAQVLAGKDYEGAVADAQQARAETQRAALRLKNLHAGDVQDSMFALRAAMAGTVTERQLNPGQEVRPDLPAPLYVISDLMRLWVIVDAPEAIAAKIREGTEVIVESEAYPGERFSATVEKVAPVLDPATRRIQVRCAVNNADRKLKPEMYVRVLFLPDHGNTQVFSLPNTSLYVEGLASFVFIETVPGTFMKRRVTVARTSGERTYISAGIKAGEQVVTEGAFLLNAEASGDAR